MIHQHPIYSFIFSLIVVGLVIKQCILKGRFLKYSLIFSFFLVFITTILLFFYEEISLDKSLQQINDYVLLGVNIVIVLYILFSTGFSISEQTFNKEIIMSLDKSKIFILLNKKDKIKNSSNLFLTELSLNKDEVIGKNLFEVIDKVWNVKSFNGNEASNNDLRSYYKNYYQQVKPNKKEKIELLVDKKSGQSVAFNLIETAIFLNGKYKGRLLVGERKSDESLFNIEKELVTKDGELESIRLKFISALEITEEAIFFKNLDEEIIWGNDSFVNNLKLDDNNIDVNHYLSLIHPDDLAYYQHELANLTPNNPIYEVTYRFSFGTSYKFVKEIGKRIFENKNANEILGFISIIQSDHYERSNIKELDNIYSTDELLVKTNELYNNHKNFQLVTFRLDNIPKINEEYGRNIGNMLIAKYVQMIRSNLISNNEDIFRVGGIEFTFVITDYRMMEKLKKVLENNEKILHVNTSFGTLNTTLEVFMGIAQSTDVKNAEELIKASEKALRFAQKEQFIGNYASYKDVI